MSDEPATKRPRGRPRDPKRIQAVLDATTELLIECGYDGLALREVATRAGVGRSLIYQWWGSKPALVQEVLFSRRDGAEVGAASDADFTTALTALIAEMVDVHSRPEFRRGLPGLISEMVNHPQLQAVAEERFIAPMRMKYAHFFDRAKRDGVVRADVDGGAMLDTLRGAVMFHTLVYPMNNSQALVKHLTTLVLDGVRPDPHPP